VSHFADGCVEAAKKVRETHSNRYKKTISPERPPSWSDVLTPMMWDDCVMTWPVTAHELGGPAGGDGVRLLHRLTLLEALFEHDQHPGEFRELSSIVHFYEKLEVPRTM
jgi:hypothetical protein